MVRRRKGSRRQSGRWSAVGSNGTRERSCCEHGCRTEKDHGCDERRRFHEFAPLRGCTSKSIESRPIERRLIKRRADANRGGIVSSKLAGFIPFAAADHFYRIGRWWWRRRAFRYYFVGFGFGLGRHRFVVQAITTREMNPSFLGNQRELLRVIRRNQEQNLRGGLRI